MKRRALSAISNSLSVEKISTGRTRRPPKRYIEEDDTKKVENLVTSNAPVGSLQVSITILSLIQINKSLNY